MNSAAQTGAENMDAVTSQYFVIYTLTLSDNATGPELEVVEHVDADPFQDVDHSARARLAQLRRQDSGKWLAMADPNAFRAIVKVYCGV